jgi:hypothetical protein
MRITSGVNWAGQGHGGASIRCLADHTQVQLAFEQGAQTFAEDRVVIGQQDANLVHPYYFTS